MAQSVKGIQQAGGSKFDHLLGVWHALIIAELWRWRQDSLDSLASQSTLIGELQAKVNETPPSQRRWMFLKMNLKVVSWSSGLHRHTHTGTPVCALHTHESTHMYTHIQKESRGARKEDEKICSTSRHFSTWQETRKFEEALTAQGVLGQSVGRGTS